MVRGSAISLVFTCSVTFRFCMKFNELQHLKPSSDAVELKASL